MDRWQAMRIFAKGRGDGELRGDRAPDAHEPAGRDAGRRRAGRDHRRPAVRAHHALGEAHRGRWPLLRGLPANPSDIVEAEAAGAGSYATPSGTLAVTASVLFGHMHVLPIVTDYLDAYSTMAARTLFVDRQVNIVEEGIDVAVRIGHLSDSGLTAARVGSVRRVVCGSPAYFERHGVPQSPQDLRDHRVAMSTGAWASTEWRFAQDQRVTVHPALMSNTNEAGIAAALAGWGLTLVLHYQIGSALLGGRLQVVLADYEEEPLPIHVVYPRGGRRRPR